MPGRIRAATGVFLPPQSRSIGDASENVAGDDDPLDLRGPFPNLAHFRVPHHSLDWIILGVAIAAVDLDCFERRAHRQLGTEQLGDRRLLTERLSVLSEPRR